MPCILDISTAVPEYSIKSEDFVKFYANALAAVGVGSISNKIGALSQKTKIETRNSCIPDFKGSDFELFSDGNYIQAIEKRMALYREKIMPLAIRAIDKLLLQTNIESCNITHVITVSCTGLLAPGIEFLLSEHFGLQHTEKLSLNFLGCYAAMKALKVANSIAEADPEACVLIVCAELCTLHFYPSATVEDMVANLLFADGAAATIVCGNESKFIKNKVVLNIDATGSQYIPGTLDLMTWNISSSAFRMYLDKNIVKIIKDNIGPIVNGFLKTAKCDIDHWAIHPGGIRIVQAVKESLGLRDSNVEDSTGILQQYGNMSSPTILFILSRMFTRIKNEKKQNQKTIFSCAFGPGVSVEMIRFSLVTKTPFVPFKHITKAENYAVQV